MTQSLYERLGGSEGIASIANALDKNNTGQAKKEAVLFVLYNIKDVVVHV